MSALSSGLVATLHDSLMILAPGGWRSVELRFSATGRGLVLVEMSTRGEGTKAPKPKPNLFVDPKTEAHRLSQAATELSSVLAEQDKRWSGGTIVVERTSAFTDWHLNSPEGKLVWFTRLDQHVLDGLLMTDSLFDALQGTERAFSDLQHAFTRRLGQATSFQLAPHASLLTIERREDVVPLRGQLVGQYLTDAFTWIWSWTDADSPSQVFERVRRVCAPDAQAPAMAALWRPHFYCDEGFAWALAAHVTVAIGARGLVRADVPEGSGAVFFASFDDPPAATAP